MQSWEEMLLVHQDRYGNCAPILTIADRSPDPPSAGGFSSFQPKPSCEMLIKKSVMIQFVNNLFPSLTKSAVCSQPASYSVFLWINLWLNQELNGINTDRTFALFFFIF
ncbi:hypothetical protein ACWA5Z_01400 [Testudinibacter sp. P80/BLE/0925]|uniref:hypothetical protein n=1 Tax=Testudinibacter sp. TW-1 TaxID=3417757 RepID=UPI003D367391